MKALGALMGFVVGGAIAACVVQQQPPMGPTAPTPARPGSPATVASGVAIPNGQYACTIDDYRPFVCQAYTNPDGTQTLEKIGGSQRFRGVIVPQGDGFYFDGVYFCPWGSCDDRVQGQFVALDDGVFGGTLDGRDSTAVAIQYMPGGVGYGGLGYGAMGYGAWGYGYGYGYGGAGYSHETPLRP